MLLAVTFFPRGPSSTFKKLFQVLLTIHGQVFGYDRTKGLIGKYERQDQYVLKTVIPLAW